MLLPCPRERLQGFAPRRRPALIIALAMLLWSTLAAPAAAQPRPAPQPPARVDAVAGDNAAATGTLPFGANLFLGNFLNQREDGLNPEYMVMPGDRVAVYTWGALQVNDVFVVDGQGNIFLPQIGPVSLAGVRNAELTAVVARAIGRIYTRNVEVYTNLLTAAPAGVYVTGRVVRPGRYAGVPSDSVLFFLDQAGGIDPMLGSYRDIVVLREGEVLAEVDLYDFILDGVLPGIQFADGDTILVRARGPVVQVSGDVSAPGLIEFDQELFTGADVMAILPQAARATEVTIEGIRGGRPFAETISVSQLGAHRLQDGDVLEIRDDGYAETILVRLEGEYEGPTLLSVRRGARLVDLLNYVAVDPELADLDGVHLRRASVAQAQKKTIDDGLYRLERSALLALSSTNVEAEIRLKEAELMKQFIASARLIQPLGRVVTSRGGHLLNVRLEDGDIVVIPRKTHVVRVGGEVQLTQAVIHHPDMRVRDYVHEAGGYTERANDDEVIVLHADASVSVGDDDMRVRPGDEILVTPKVDPKLLQNSMDLVSVIYQIAVSAAVVLAI
ncbi:polysaccharide biosynthesis/export family protein [Haliangium ochraceum]|uniref:Polysaccharide export protein n=1 Tax=Haliangium ochraceum (strain DSM 14365 / JCM 11303 / SMP-2) TaxID=502025 RepID=D0LJS0_HALO1|nr:polysaccharide biosynthesis/export family protein [Haliangium ochraceum]ACY18427.1 polysaccharide export protein [Haliangium ochraceum DSM 14365]